MTYLRGLSLVIAGLNILSGWLVWLGYYHPDLKDVAVSAYFGVGLALIGFGAWK